MASTDTEHQHVPIPLTWLESTFNARSRTEQLLRPELENGLITQHDFDAAVDFFPGAQRYYSIAGGIIGTLAIVVYGQMRRPPLPVHRVASLTAFASAGGVIGGTVVRANAHADFFRTLDNRPAFFQALDNIQSRLGEKPSGLQRPTSAYPNPSSDNENQELADHAINSRGWGEQTPPVNRTAVDHTPSPTQPLQRKSRWEEIRAEHARSMATRSSWDELRQNASRTKFEHNTESDQVRRSQDPAADRQIEQQKFDAMLEAERRRTASGS